MHANHKRTLTLPILLVLALVSLGLFLAWDLPKAWQWALERRAYIAGGLIVVATSIGLSTVLFQTITANRILTPSLMGFDALYILLQTALVYFFGLSALSPWEARGLFAVEVGIMVGFAILLYALMFRGGRTSLDLLLLVGIVFGVFFRSVSSLLQRLIDPGLHAALQDRFFANFSYVDKNLLWVTTALTIGCAAVMWRKRRIYDTLLLGRDISVNLGINYRREVIITLVLIAVLVSSSTALVGPVLFFGLLVAHLSYQLMRTDRHAWTLPGAVLIGITALLAGQFILGQVFAFNTALSIIIELFGGLAFLYLLLRKGGINK
ncbi:iron chelate uptake ABC transporter family permease subunit [Corynebacterium pseudodiphtheriticum]|uniref:iron chelate uptake ABC transporter family permease subunit n=1 Tax=Corynebacterium pseudodiphtheriticum TaxID=37637 RepID=UPI00254299CB|nr:iron chelate uptake ABC transporter family permease subunit [Corynebacterium pseudodiphtheriticum]MDK4328837.1 iron chelate uptake ABC transporter family permease subunit [Corynebacterium pseudodiphtheriticum]